MWTSPKSGRPGMYCKHYLSNGYTVFAMDLAKWMWQNVHMIVVMQESDCTPTAYDNLFLEASSTMEQKWLWGRPPQMGGPHACACTRRCLCHAGVCAVAGRRSPGSLSTLIDHIAPPPPDQPRVACMRPFAAGARSPHLRRRPIASTCVRSTNSSSSSRRKTLIRS